MRDHLGEGLIALNVREQPVAPPSLCDAIGIRP
jgi:hypothetical protein